MDYLFFTLYHFFEVSPFNKWKSEWKSSLTLSIILGYLFVSFFNFYAVLINSKALDFSIDFNMPPVIFAIFYFTSFVKYHLNDYWKDLIKNEEFILKKKNIYILSSLFFLLCILSIVLSFYLLFNYAPTVPPETTATELSI